MMTLSEHEKVLLATKVFVCIVPFYTRSYMYPRIVLWRKGCLLSKVTRTDNSIQIKSCWFLGICKCSSSHPPASSILHHLPHMLLAGTGEDLTQNMISTRRHNVTWCRTALCPLRRRRELTEGFELIIHFVSCPFARFNPL